MQTEGAVGSAHVGWQDADQELRRIAAIRSGLDVEEARWLRVAAQTGVHRHYGFATILVYMERILGYGARAARERLRVAEALVVLPETDDALADGRIPYSAARELTRKVNRETEGAWLRTTAGCSLRDIEAMRSGVRIGDIPDDERHPEFVEHRLSFEVPAATFALFRDARRALETEMGHALDEADVLAAMCRAVLGGPGDEGRASYQIALTTCQGCGRTWQDGAGQPVEVPEVVLEQALCDAQVIGRVDAEQPERAKQEIPPAVRRQVVRRDHGRCVVPGCRSARFLDAHHLRFRSEGGPHEPANLAILCGGHHRALHEGRLAIEGTAPELRFFRADGRPYTTTAPLTPDGAAPAPDGAAISRDEVQSALRTLGFRSTEARAAVEHAVTHVGRDAPLELLLREALKVAASRARN